MPWTLYRYILKELLKLLAVSLAVLVAVISMALAIKPLSDGLLGPWGLIKFIIYTAPTILDIALPFAAAFAGTIVFCRMTSDNEVLACRASGMSYLALILPVLALGAVLTIGMVYLSNWVVPSFYRMARFTVQRDILRLVVSELENGKAYRFGTSIVYADAVGEQDAEQLNLAMADGGTEAKPERLIMLKGVAVGQLDTAGRIRSDSTAERADLLLYRQANESWVRLRMRNAMYYSATTDEPWGYTESVEHVFALPNPFSNRLQFLSWPDLKALRNEPADISDIYHIKNHLVGEMECEQALRTSEEQLRTAGRAGTVSFFGMTEQERYILSAPRIQRQGRFIEMYSADDRRIQIDYFSNGLPRHRVRAQTGRMVVEHKPGGIVIRLDLKGVDVEDLRRQGRTTQHTEMSLRPLRWSGNLFRTPLKSQSTFDVLEQAFTKFKGVDSVANGAKFVQTEIIRLGRKTVALLHQRAASAVGCMLVLMLGALLSMHLKGSMPLVIYLWTFGLCAAAVIIARGGENVLSDPSHARLAGILAVWSGNLLVAGALAVTGWRLTRS